MKGVTVKFVWGSAEQIKGEWHLGLWGWYDRLPGYRRSGLAISVRGLLRWAAAAGVACYLMGATALYVWFQRNPYNQVSYTDAVLLPIRWERVREARGRAMIDEGLADLKAQRWGEAAMKLRAGLARAPHHARARLALAQFYAAANQRPNAIKVLTEDLDQGYPGRTYLERLFALATESEEFEITIGVCERFEREPSDHTWRTLQKNLALLRAHRAEDVLKAAGSGDSASDFETRVTALIELKRPAEALTELGRWEQLPRSDRALVLRLKLRALRDADRLPEMNAAAEEYRRLAPADPRVLAYIVGQRTLAGQATEAMATLEDYFRRFAGTEENLVTIVQVAGEVKSAPLVQRCADEVAAHGFEGKVVRAALVQAQLAVSDWAGASATLTQLKRQLRAPNAGEAMFNDWVSRLLAVAMRPDEAPVAGLLEFFQKRPLSMRVYRQTCEVLVQARRFEAARSVLELGERAFPSSRTLAAFRATVDEALKPAPVVAAVSTAPAAKSEKDFFRDLQLAQQQERWADAAQSIREVRVAKPRWLASREDEVLEAQMRVAAKRGDALELVAAARLYLDGSGARANRAVGLARELGEGGDKPSGERVLQEVLRRNPDFPMAVRLRAEWKPKAAAEGKSGN